MRVQALLPVLFAGAVVILAAPVATVPIEAATEQAALADDQKDDFAALERLRAMLHLDAPAKPAAGATYTGNDSCRYANDGECDDPRIGTGACHAGTDYSDCWRLAQGVEDDSCRFANDGECDEPHFGTGACAQATDRTDCGDVGYLRFQTDTCATAFDGVCNEPGIGDGKCEARTDRSDCLGRERPPLIYDNYFGYDDRVLVDISQMPWSVIGLLTLSRSGSGCTATLVAANVVATAAHCITSDSGRIDARSLFEVGDLGAGALSARVTAYLVADTTGQKVSDESETDWALLRLDRPLGDELGFVGVRAVADIPLDQLLLMPIYQAGYSWDTGDHLSGNIGCAVLLLTGVNMLQHNCDTTHGDSGSPLMIEENGLYYVVATDAAFDNDADGRIVNVATRADAWAGLLADFAAGQIGTPIEAATKTPSKR